MWLLTPCLKEATDGKLPMPLATNLLTDVSCSIDPEGPDTTEILMPSNKIG